MDSRAGRKNKKEFFQKNPAFAESVGVNPFGHVQSNLDKINAQMAKSGLVYDKTKGDGEYVNQAEYDRRHPKESKEDSYVHVNFEQAPKKKRPPNKPPKQTQNALPKQQPVNSKGKEIPPKYKVGDVIDTSTGSGTVKGRRFLHGKWEYQRL